MMEIEIKARLSGDAGELNLASMMLVAQEKLFTSKKYPLIDYSYFTYKDVYLTQEDQNMARVRSVVEHVPATGDDIRKVYITRKTKSFVDGVEHNLEDETGVDLSFENAAFEYLDKGYDIMYQKTKTGFKYLLTDTLSVFGEFAWTPVEDKALTGPVDPISLGHFFEIEKLLPGDASAEDQATAHKEILDVLAALGLPEDSIEPLSWKSLDKNAREEYHKEKNRGSKLN